MIRKSTWLLLTLIVVLSIAFAYFVQIRGKTKLVPTGTSPTSESFSDTQVQQTTTQDTIQVTSFEKEKLYLLINSHRKDANLTPLTIDSRLESSAELKIADMVRNNYYRHQDTADTQSWYLFRQTGYAFQLAGENLSFGLNTPWQVFSAWLESPEHNQQLLHPEYQDFGIGYDCETLTRHADGGCIVVLHLGLLSN